MGITSVLTGFTAMMGMLLMSLPVAVIMVTLGVIGGVMLYGWPLLNSMGPVIWGVQNENILTAIPLFVLLGELLLRSGLADKMYGALSLWLGRLPGGLLHTNIGSCALFAATSGSSVATAATVGTVALRRPVAAPRHSPNGAALHSPGGSLLQRSRRSPGDTAPTKAEP